MHDPMQSAPAGRDRGARIHQQGLAEAQGQDSPNLFDDARPDDGNDRRDVGQQAALNAADVRWTGYAWRAMEELAAERIEFTAETLRERVGRPLAGSDNVMGSLFSQARKADLIEPVGYQQATRPEAQGRVIRVWQGVAR